MTASASPAPLTPTSPATPSPLHPPLEVHGLSVGYRHRRRGRLDDVVHDVSFTVEPGQTVALVGQSGSGKSTIARAVSGLLPGNGADHRRLRPGDRARGVHLLARTQWRPLRGRALGFVPQDPLSSLDPLQRIGRQIADALLARRDAPRPGPRPRARGARPRRHRRRRAPGPRLPARAVRRPAPARAHRHGDRRPARAPRRGRADVGPRRHRPEADPRPRRRPARRAGSRRSCSSPTTSRSRRSAATGSSCSTTASCASTGRPPRCWSPRATRTRSRCSPTHRRRRRTATGTASRPGQWPRRPASPSEPVVQVSGVHKTFAARTRRDAPVRALDDVSLTVHRGSVHALVGESGSGKSTLARIVAGLSDFDDGAVEVLGRDLPRRPPHANPFARSLQLVYQNPLPSWTRATRSGGSSRSRCGSTAWPTRPSGAAASPRSSTQVALPDRGARAQRAGDLRRAAPAGGARPHARARPGRPRPGRADVRPGRHRAGADHRPAARAARRAGAELPVHLARPRTGPADRRPRHRAAARRGRRERPRHPVFDAPATAYTRELLDAVPRWDRALSRADRTTLDAASARPGPARPGGAAVAVDASPEPADDRRPEEALQGVE